MSGPEPSAGLEGLAACEGPTVPEGPTVLVEPTAPTEDGKRVRIVLMPGNNALIDARVMKNLRTAAALGYDAIALGLSRGEAVEEHLFDWGGRVIIQPVPLRYEAWRRYRRWRISFDRTDRSIGRAYAAYLRQDRDFENGRAVRDGGRAGTATPAERPSSVTKMWRRLRYLAVRVLVKARSLSADREIRRDAWEPAKLEAWRRRRFAWLKLAPWRTHWRKAVPKAVDDAMAVAGQLDQLAPDIVHVHDVYMMHAAAQYAIRAARRGEAVRLIYDAREFVPGLAHVPPRRVAAYAALEREFMPDFDRVVSVSVPMATAVAERHGLIRRPDVVMNAPMEDLEATDVPSVRQAAGVGEDVPLLVYSGGVNPARGVGTIVRALARLPRAHLAVVVNNRGTAVVHLEELAGELGLADRLHLVPFVPHDQVTRYLGSADVGLSPLSRVANHDLTVTNKFCEYIEAGLPIVTSDTPAQAELVRELGLGEVFVADDAASLASAVNRVLDNLDSLKTRIVNDQALRFRFSWAAQAEVLAGVYAEETAVLGLPVPPARS